MYKKLRIVFCIITVAIAAAAIFIFVYAGLMWGILSLFAAVICGVLMYVFKQLQEKKELKDNPPPPKGDFITGKVEKQNTENDSEGENK